MKIKSKYLRSLGIVIVILSVIMIIRERLQYDNLHSKNDPICQVADFFKYKEDVETNIAIWSVVLILGLVTLLISRKRSYVK